MREAQTLAAIADALAEDDPARALDVLVMRLTAMQRARAKGGRWDKASQLELIPTQAAEPGPAGL
eukprot:1551618-Lingulodinium_polyedra.AAC.1